jgi:hypothetical protein
MHYWYGLITAADTNNLLLISAALGGPIPKIQKPKNPDAGCKKIQALGPARTICVSLETPTTGPASLHGSQVAAPRSLIGWSIQEWIATSFLHHTFYLWFLPHVLHPWEPLLSEPQAFNNGPHPPPSGAWLGRTRRCATRPPPGSAWLGLHPVAWPRPPPNEVQLRLHPAMVACDSASTRRCATRPPPGDATSASTLWSATRASPSDGDGSGARSHGELNGTTTTWGWRQRPPNGARRLSFHSTTMARGAAALLLLEGDDSKA